jgi:superoxide dismutase, Cu-Zn family
MLIGISLMTALVSTYQESLPPDVPKARAELKNAQGQSVGIAELLEGANGLLITVRLHDISPGAHAVHLHETGKCDAPAFETAGAHFNPAGAAHGVLARKGPHAGDLPNVHVPASKRIDVDLMASGVRLRGNNGLLDADGASVVVHAAADDYHSDPAGNAGDRVACGLIR